MHKIMGDKELVKDILHVFGSYMLLSAFIKFMAPQAKAEGMAAILFFSAVTMIFVIFVGVNAVFHTCPNIVKKYYPCFSLLNNEGIIQRNLRSLFQRDFVLYLLVALLFLSPLAPLVKASMISALS